MGCSKLALSHSSFFHPSSRWIFPQPHSQPSQWIAFLSWPRCHKPHMCSGSWQAGSSSPAPALIKLCASAPSGSDGFSFPNFALRAISNELPHALKKKKIKSFILQHGVRTATLGMTVPARRLEINYITVALGRDPSTDLLIQLPSGTQGTARNPLPGQTGFFWP